MSRLDEEAERDLAKLEKSRAGKGGQAPEPSPRKGKAAQARFIAVDESDPHGRRAGVYWIGVAQDKKTLEWMEGLPQWICSPLGVLAQTRDQNESEWGRLVEFPDALGHVHRWAMPMSMTARNGDELREHLLSQGLQITADNMRRRRLLDYIISAKTEKFARCVNRTGWHGDAFVLPDRTIGDSPEEPTIFQTAAPEGAKLSKGGTLKQWRELVAKPCAGNSRLVLALSAAFAAPCLALVGQEGGGFHFRGSSSVGKSTTLTVGVSVYGPPAYKREWKVTDNGLEPVAALHSDMMLALDEIQQLDSRHAAGAAYLLANGQGKSRAKRDGSAKAPATWRVMFISAGEIGLSELVEESGGRQRAGIEVRVVDVAADANEGMGLFQSLPAKTTPGAFADQLKASAAAHYGHAFPAFLDALIRDLPKFRNLLANGTDRLAEDLAGPDAAGQVRRVAQRFALIASAGELATLFKLTGWETGEAIKSIRRCFADWLRDRGTRGNTEPAAMLAAVRGFLEINGEARFTEITKGGDRRDHAPRTINRAGFVRMDEVDRKEFLILREVFRKDVCKGFDHRAVSRVLADLGALKVESNCHTSTERVDGTRMRVYRILPGIWSVEPE